jgi:phosphatidylglycerophosphate synthase
MSRRPLASRDTNWAKGMARWLTTKNVTPNGISIAAMGFAGVGGAAFWASAHWNWLAILGALMCQARLLCNLFDGMVAVEGGKGTKDGPFWNEAPDRVSDLLLIGGAGLGAGVPALGFAAASLAVLTAYLRELGRAEGLPPDFGGPMAKPQRMAVLTVAGVVAVLWPPALIWALWVIVAGAVLTVALRSVRLLRGLKNR